MIKAMTSGVKKGGSYYFIIIDLKTDLQTIEKRID